MCEYMPSMCILILMWLCLVRSHCSPWYGTASECDGSLLWNDGNHVAFVPKLGLWLLNSSKICSTKTISKILL